MCRAWAETAPRQKDCLLIDFVDIAKRHDLCGVGTLVGKKKLNLHGGSLLDELDREECGSREERVRLHQYREPTYEQIDVLGRSRYVWQKRGEHYALCLVDATLYCMSVEGGYMPIVMQLGTKRLLSDSVLPLGYAMGVCEDYARSIGADNYAVKDAAWRTDFATEKQINLLRKKGISFRPSITKGEAADLLSSVMNVGATEKQILFIKYHDLHDAPELLTKREAMEIIRQYKEAVNG